MKRIPSLCAALALLPVLVGAVAVAGEPIDIHGSISQSYLRTIGNDYLVEDSSSGSFEFTEVLLGFGRKLNDRIRLGAQLICRDFGQEERFETGLDWAYGDVKLCESFGLRAGKVKLPLGFYNEFRDVDSARTTILLPQGIYPENTRTLTNAYQGVGAYGTLGRTGRLGFLNYHAYFGTSHIPDRNHQQDILRRRLNDDSLDMETERLGGWALTYDTPVDGLRFGYSAMLGSYTSTLTKPVPPYNVKLKDGLDMGFDMYVYGVEWTRRQWTFVFEYANILIDLDMSPAYMDAASTVVLVPGRFPVTLADMARVGEANGSRDYSSWHAGVTWQCAAKTSLDLGYCTVRVKHEANTPNNSRDDITIGVRHDFHRQWIGKLEYHQMRDLLEVLAGDDRNWGLALARVTFVF